MKTVIYSKFSNERARKFSIRTDICQEGECRWVEKVANTQEALPHVEGILRWRRELEQKFADRRIAFNQCENIEKGVKLAYVQAENLEEYLDERLDGGRADEAYEALMAYVRFLQETHSETEFVETAQFEQVFGKVKFPQKLRCGLVSDIDLVCANLLLTDPVTVIDYEWTFDFPIPGNYLAYRALHYYLETHSKRQVLKNREPYRQVGITDEELIAYRKMEENFQRYITGEHVPMREMYRDISPGVKEIKVLMGENLQIYESFGTGFEEHHSSLYPIREEQVQVRVPVSEGVDFMRVDPGSCACAVKIHKLNFQPGDIPAQYFCENGWVSGQWLYIAKEDPNLTNIPVPTGAKELEIFLEVHPVEASFLEGMARRMRQDKEELQKLRAQTEHQRRQIHEMENTKVWRAYQGCRGIVKRERKKEREKEQ